MTNAQAAKLVTKARIAMNAAYHRVKADPTRANERRYQAAAAKFKQALVALELAV